MSTQIPTSVPYAWPHDSSLSPRTTALIVIDMQRDFLSPSGYFSTQVPPEALSRFQALIPRLVSLLSTFRRAGFPVYHTREGHAAHQATITSRERHRSKIGGGEIGSQGPLGKLLIRGERGHEIIPELQPLPIEPVIDKPGRGAFVHTELDKMLRAKGIQNLVICGVTAEACVSSTAREASDRGYDVLVVEDGVESSSDELRIWSLEALKVEGGLIGVTGLKKDVIEAIESWVNIREGR
ncbi:isochorismatase family protein [Lophiotrema nucula]|uniref:Isochorismatase family protein n=1 Tax=Lophiotrema nucula TaxID=690887 RepID=A0A6A5Z3V3_9PLEO|nr:isochorismatase family protein [Lophiotrema nucula]